MKVKDVTYFEVSTVESLSKKKKKNKIKNLRFFIKIKFY
jgi:hypothetical protein